MNRSYDERILWYFFRSISSATLFMIILAGSITFVGLVKEDGVIFITLGIIFFLIAIWQVLRGYISLVKGEEVDASAEKFMRNIRFERNAMNALSLDEDEFEEIERVTLHGYCCFGIETEPMYRWDARDERARSSNYQVTCLCMEKGFLFAYSVVKSLVDTEYSENAHVWNINELEYAEIRNIYRDCSVDATKGSDIRKEGFLTLVVRNKKYEEFAYAIGIEQKALAESVVTYVMKSKERAARMRMPGKKLTGGESAKMQWKDLSKRQRNAINIGIIEDKFHDLNSRTF